MHPALQLNGKRKHRILLVGRAVLDLAIEMHESMRVPGESETVLGRIPSVAEPDTVLHAEVVAQLVPLQRRGVLRQASLQLGNTPQLRPDALLLRGVVALQQ